MKYGVIMLFIIVFYGCKHQNTDLMNGIDFKSIGIKSKHLPIQNSRKFNSICVKDQIINKIKPNKLYFLFAGEFKNDNIKIFFNDKLGFENMLNVDLSTDLAGYYEFDITDNVNNISLQINISNKINLSCDSIHYAYLIEYRDSTLYIRNVEQFPKYQ